MPDIQSIRAVDIHPGEEKQEEVEEQREGSFPERNRILARLRSPFSEPSKRGIGYVARPVYTVTYVIFGRSGVGKSTFAQGFLHVDRKSVGNTHKITQLETRFIETKDIIYEIIGIDTPGLGDDPRIEQTIIPVVDLMREKYASGRELFNRKESMTPIMYIFYVLSDNRVNNHDMKAMKILTKYGNVIPLIGKADTYEPQELRDFQNSVHDQLQGKVNVLNLRWPLPDIEIPNLNYEWKYPYPIIGHPRHYHWGENQSDVHIMWDDYTINATTLLRKSLFTPDEIVPAACTDLVLKLGLVFSLLLE